MKMELSIAAVYVDEALGCYCTLGNTHIHTLLFLGGKVPSPSANMVRILLSCMSSRTSRKVISPFSSPV
jgi:hypothetical protein